MIVLKRYDDYNSEKHEIPTVSVLDKNKRIRTEQVGKFLHSFGSAYKGDLIIDFPQDLAIYRYGQIGLNGTPDDFQYALFTDGNFVVLNEDEIDIFL